MSYLIIDGLVWLKLQNVPQSNPTTSCGNEFLIAENCKKKTVLPIQKWLKTRAPQTTISFNVCKIYFQKCHYKNYLTFTQLISIYYIFKYTVKYEIKYFTIKVVDNLFILTNVLQIFVFLSLFFKV